MSKLTTTVLLAFGHPLNSERFIETARGDYPNLKGIVLEKSQDPSTGEMVSKVSALSDGPLEDFASHFYVDETEGGVMPSPRLQEGVFICDKWGDDPATDDTDPLAALLAAMDKAIAEDEASQQNA